MNCQTAWPRLSAYVDNELDADDVRELRDHLATCRGCAERLAAYNRIRAGIRALPRQAPPVRLREAVFARATPAYRRRSFYVGLGRQFVAATALAVTVAAVVFTASLFIARSRTSSLGNPGLAPRIVAIEPRSGTVDWAPSRAIRITFNKPMDQASVAAALRITIPAPGGEVDATYLRETLGWDGDTLLLGDHGGLRSDTDYFIEFAAGVARDRYGNALLGTDTRLAFRTALVLTAREQPTPTPATFAVVVTSASTPTAPAPVTIANGGQTTATVEPVATGVLRLQPTTQPARTSPPTLPPPPPPPQPSQSTQAAAVVVPEPVSTPEAPAPVPAPSPALATPTVPAPTVTAPAGTVTATAPVPVPTATPELPYTVPAGFGALYSASPPVRAALGLPTGPAVSVAVTAVRFERGLMYRRGDNATIYVLFFEDPGVWFAFADSWAPGGPDPGGAGPVAGQYVPREGFGAIWNANSDFRQRLGYALAPESEQFDALAQPFGGGLMLTSSGKWVYVLYAKGTYERYADTSR